MQAGSEGHPIFHGGKMDELPTLNFATDAERREFLKTRRYRSEDQFPPLSSHSAKNRITVDGVTGAWTQTGWRNLFDCEIDCPVTTKNHVLTLFEDEASFAKASFTTYKFDSDVDAFEFYSAADSMSQDLTDMAYALNKIMVAVGLTDDEDSFDFFQGMRLVEFDKLILCAPNLRPSRWIVPVREFIRTRFRRTNRAFYYALFLCPFPLEYQATDDHMKVPEQGFDHRRRAMVRLYERALNVNLVVSKQDKWWMARLL